MDCILPLGNLSLTGLILGNATMGKSEGDGGSCMLFTRNVNAALVLGYDTLTKGETNAHAILFRGMKGSEYIR